MKKMLQISALIVLALGCSQNKLSQRDVKRQQQKNSITIKRQELSAVAGTYEGTLKNTTGVEQRIVLKLEVKDLPEVIDGQVDPILVPRLVGFVRFLYGEEGSNEYIDAPIKKAEYTPASSSLYIIATHEQFQDLIMQLGHSSNRLSGSWGAAAVGAGGALEVTERSSL